MLNISMDFLYINIINFGGIYIMIDKVMKETIIEKEISETDLDHIKSGPNELVIGNFWIFKGKITIQKQQNCSDNRRRRNWKLM